MDYEPSLLPHLWDPFRLAALGASTLTAVALWPLTSVMGAAQLMNAATTSAGRRSATDFLRTYSSVAETSRGPVEYASIGYGPAVLMAHGVGGGYDQGLFLTQILGERGSRFLSVSRPGYLRTPLSTGESPEAQADAYAALLDQLNVRRTAVLAISAGAPSALQFALRHPERCSAVVLLSAATHRLRTNDVPFYVWMQRLMYNDVNMRMVLRLAEEKPHHVVRHHISDPTLQDAVLSNPEQVKLFQNYYRTTYPASLRVCGVDNDIRQLTSLVDYPLERITVPMLVLHGTADRTASFSHARFVAHLVPGARLVAVEGGEHLCIISHKGTVVPTITSFLDECAAC